MPARLSLIARSAWLHLAAITVVVIVAYVRLLHPDFHASWDIVTVHAFGLNYASRVWHEFGVMPLWDPFRFVGFPFVADPQPAMWYPINLVMILLGEVTLQHVQAQVVLHLLIAGWTMYAFARWMFTRRLTALVCGMLYPLTGAFVGHVTHVGMLNTAAWVPLLLWLSGRAITERRWSMVFGSGFVVALMVLAGHFQTALFFLVLFVAWVVMLAVREYGWKNGTLRALVVLAVTALIAGGISAIQLVPTWEFANMTTRASTNFNWAMTESFVPMQFATLLVPDLFGAVTADPYWGADWGSQHYAYTGVLPLLLIALGLLVRRRDARQRFFMIVVVLGVLLIIGRFAFVQPLLYLFVPLFDHVRAFANGLFVVHLGLVVLAGFGLDALLTDAVNVQSAWKRVTSGARFIAAASIAGLIAISAVYAYAKFQPMPNPQLESILLRAGTGVVLLLFFGALSIAAIHQQCRANANRLFAGVILCIVLVADLWTFTLNHQHVARTGSVHALLQTPYPVEYLADQASDHWYRVHAQRRDDILEPGYSYQIGGYNPLITDRYAHLMRLPPKNGGQFHDVMSALGVEYYVSEEESPADKWELMDGMYYRNPAFRGRVWPVAEVVGVPSGNEDLDALEERVRKADLRKTAIVEGRDQALQKFDTDVTVSEVEDRINALAFTVTASQDAFLVMSDAMYDGWKLEIDGEARSLYWTDLTLRGFEVPAGTHAVAMRFEPASVRWASTVSLASVVLTVGAATAFWFAERRRLLTKKDATKYSVGAHGPIV